MTNKIMTFIMSISSGAAIGNLLGFFLPFDNNVKLYYLVGYFVFSALFILTFVVREIIHYIEVRK